MEKVLIFLFTMLIVAFLALVGAFWVGWVLMIAFGVLHHLFAWPVTGIAYWPSVALAFCAQVLFNAFFRSSVELKQPKK